MQAQQASSPYVSEITDIATRVQKLWQVPAMAVTVVKDGETVYLHSGSADVLTGYSEQVEFGVSEPGVSVGRWLEETGNYVFVPLQEPTPGDENTPPVE